MSVCRNFALQIPIELLQKIFLLLPNLYETPRRSWDSSGRPAWIAITYVCRYWRSAALSLRELWSTIAIGLSIPWARAMMERSDPLPMDLNIRVVPFMGDYYFGLTAIIDLLHAASNRTRTLHIIGDPTELVTILSGLRSPSSLESLRLYVKTDDDDRSVVVDLPETMFNGEAPHLYRLLYANSICIAPYWLLSGITQLSFKGIGDLHELLGVLQETPQLEVLRVFDFFNLWDETDLTDRTIRATLPHLSLLSFGDGIPDNFVVFSSAIDGPPMLRRHLFSWAPVSNWDQWASGFPGVQSLIPGDSAPGVDDGGLRVAEVNGGHVHGSFQVRSRAQTGSESVKSKDALFRFHLEWRAASGLPLYPSPLFLLPSLCAHLSTSRIEDLVIAPEIVIEHNGPYERVTGVPDATAQLQELLAAMPSVKTLRLHSGTPACVSILRALSASSEPLLPHLERVFVVDAILHYVATAVHSALTDITDGYVLHGKLTRMNMGTEIVDAVRERSGLEVVLVGCDVDDEVLDTLRQHAQVVIQDKCKYV